MFWLHEWEDMNFVIILKKSFWLIWPTSFQRDLVAVQQLFEHFLKRNYRYFETFNSVFLGPFNKPLRGGCQLTPWKHKKKQTRFKCLKPKKASLSLSSLWILPPFHSHWSVPLFFCKEPQQWIHLTRKYYINCQRLWSAVCFFFVFFPKSLWVDGIKIMWGC